MRRRAQATAAKRLAQTAGLALLLAACTEAIDAGGGGRDAGADDDPLVVADEPAPGSLDDLHRRVIVRSCAGQPGLCHAGQFEPDLRTPALFYANLVNAPGLERPWQLRVRPGEPDDSLLVDKLRDRDVATQMPLGAPPLAEEEIAAIEAWIRDGALRAPGAPPAPLLNQAPHAPEIAIFGADGTRLDAFGPVEVAPGDVITLRHSVRDFETPDAAIPYGVFVLQTPDFRQVAIAPGTSFPNLAFTAYDADAPDGVGDLLNWTFTWTVPETVTLLDDAGTGIPAPSSGLSLTVVAAYVDQLAPGGMATFGFEPDLLKVK